MSTKQEFLLGDFVGDLSSGDPGMVLSSRNPRSPPTNIEVSSKTWKKERKNYQKQLRRERHLQYLVELRKSRELHISLFLDPLWQHLVGGNTQE